MALCWIMWYFSMLHGNVLFPLYWLCLDFGDVLVNGREDLAADTKSYQVVVCWWRPSWVWVNIEVSCDSRIEIETGIINTMSVVKLPPKIEQTKLLGLLLFIPYPPPFIPHPVSPPCPPSPSLSLSLSL